MAAREHSDISSELAPAGAGALPLAKRLAPWGISAALHLVALVGLAMFTMAVIYARSPEKITAYAAVWSQEPGAGVTDVASNVDASSLAPQVVPAAGVEAEFTQAPVAAAPAARANAAAAAGGAQAAAGPARVAKPLDLVGSDDSSRSTGPQLGLEGSGAPSAPPSAFFGTVNVAHHVVFVVDRSGSMLDTFDAVRREILTSIGRLQSEQDFHVILFAGGEPIENSPARLVEASFAEKRRVADFLIGVRAGQQTNPVPALQRAFETLSSSNRRAGKLIYLLTDGVFSDSEAVVRAIRQANGRHEVQINTYLYGYRPPEAVEVMKQIADENGGQYQYVGFDG